MEPESTDDVIYELVPVEMALIEATKKRMEQIEGALMEARKDGDALLHAIAAARNLTGAVRYQDGKFVRTKPEPAPVPPPAL
jgi:hypothetical protein